MITTWPGWQTGKLLGEGSFGKVYEITREEFGVAYRAALKVITIPSMQSDVKAAYEEGMDKDSVTQYFHSFVEDIVAEFALMSQMKGNSNIVSYEDHMVIQHEDEIAWDILIRMELLTALPDYAKDNPLNEEDVIRLGIHMARALELCRKRKILHRDIKPENIFVSKDGDFKLGDFGVARVAEKTISVMSRKGTYNYMAPEVYRGEEYSYSADIYSLGMVLYRFLNNNRVPFLPPYPTPIQYSDREKALNERMSGKAMREPENGSEQLKKIVLKACAYRSEDRYESATELREALEDLARMQKQDASVKEPQIVVEQPEVLEAQIEKQEESTTIQEIQTTMEKEPVEVPQKQVVEEEKPQEVAKEQPIVRQEKSSQNIEPKKIVEEQISHPKVWWKTKLAGAGLFLVVVLFGTLLFGWDYFYDAGGYIYSAELQCRGFLDALHQSVSLMVYTSIPLVAVGHLWSRIWKVPEKNWKSIVPFCLLMFMGLVIYGAGGIMLNFLGVIGCLLENPVGVILGIVLVVGIWVGMFQLRKQGLWNRRWVGTVLTGILVLVWASMQLIEIQEQAYSTYLVTSAGWITVNTQFYDWDTPIVLIENIFVTYFCGMIFVGAGYLWSSTKKWCKWIWIGMQIVFMLAAMIFLSAVIGIVYKIIALPIPANIGLLLGIGAVIGTDKLLGKLRKKTSEKS